MEFTNLLDAKNRHELREWLINNHDKAQLFQSRLQKLIENTKKGVMYGEWNDNGRLTE